MNKYIIECQYYYWNPADFYSNHDSIREAETIEEALSEKCRFSDPCHGSRKCQAISVHDQAGRKIWDKIEADKVGVYNE